MPAGRSSSFTCSYGMACKLGGGIENERNQSDNHRDIYQQYQVAAESCLPGQLADTRQIAQDFDRDSRSKCQADRNSGKRKQLRPSDGQNMPEHDSNLIEA